MSYVSFEKLHCCRVEFKGHGPPCKLCRLAMNFVPFYFAPTLFYCCGDFGRCGGLVLIGIGVGWVFVLPGDKAIA